MKVQHFAAEAQTLDMSKMRRLNPAKRYTLAAAFLTLQYAQALDDITEMFIKRMRQLHHSAKAALAQYRLNTQQQTDTLIVTLRDLIIAYQSEGEVSDRFAAMATVIGVQPDQSSSNVNRFLATMAIITFPSCLNSTALNVQFYFGCWRR